MKTLIRVPKVCNFWKLGGLGLGDAILIFLNLFPETCSFGLRFKEGAILTFGYWICSHRTIFQTGVYKSVKKISGTCFFLNLYF